MDISGKCEEFEKDPYPGAPKVLFVGHAHSSHTYSWIDLLKAARINVRVFGVPTGAPAESWKVRTYLTVREVPGNMDPAFRKSFFPCPEAIAQNREWRLPAPSLEEWLAQIIRQWQPDIIHTLGIEPGAEFYFRARHAFNLRGLGKWVLQLRGGSDLALNRFEPNLARLYTQMMSEADQIVTDNKVNPQIAASLGVPPGRFASICPVPGTGGIDVAALSSEWPSIPSARRIILWPKAYECRWSTALPVLEALKLVASEIQPFKIFMLAADDNTVAWSRTLPQELQQNAVIAQRIPRDELLQIMRQARVLLAPTLVDGVPNSLYEAMACGALPIVSPLDTIVPVVKNRTNVLFARNLYPEEIAEALRQAMRDDALVDGAAWRNRLLVSRIANRETIAPQVARFYSQIAKKESVVC